MRPGRARPRDRRARWSGGPRARHRPLAIAAAQSAPDRGSLDFRVSAAEEFRLRRDEQPFDLVVAIRVGALDGRHPELEQAALAHLEAATTPDASVYIDRGDPLEAVPLH